MLASDTSDIVVACMGALGVVLAAVVPVYLSLRRGQQSIQSGQDEIKRRVGDPNGHESLSKIGEEHLDKQDAHTEQLAHIEGRVDQIGSKLDDHLSFSDRQMARFEQLLDDHQALARLITRRADHIDQTLDTQDDAAAAVKSDLNKEHS